MTRKNRYLALFVLLVATTLFMVALLAYRAHITDVFFEETRMLESETVGTYIEAH